MADKYCDDCKDDHQTKPIEPEKGSCDDCKEPKLLKFIEIRI